MFGKEHWRADAKGVYAKCLKNHSKGVDIMDKTKSIIKNIILAQIASDGGKNIKTLQNMKGAKEASKKGYAVKDKYIKTAITLINTTPMSGINYYVEEKPDQNGYPSMVIYFDIKLNEKRYQISFHSPKNRTTLSHFCSKGRKTRWTKEINGSREACIELASILSL